ncbi:MAG: hypothetical protein Q9215_000513 [Flavoplaca cf. flavocitrina]
MFVQLSSRQRRPNIACLSMKNEAKWSWHIVKGQIVRLSPRLVVRVVKKIVQQQYHCYCISPLLFIPNIHIIASDSAEDFNLQAESSSEAPGFLPNIPAFYAIDPHTTNPTAPNTTLFQGDILMGALGASHRFESYPMWRTAKVAYAILAASIIAPNLSATWTIGGHGAVTSKQDRRTYVHLPLDKGRQIKIRMLDGTILAEADGIVIAKQDRKIYVHLLKAKGGKLRSGCHMGRS